LLFGASLPAFTQANVLLQEEFHQTFAIPSDGHVSLEGITGVVVIKAWDRNEVRVDAVKRAYTKERLAEVNIKIDAGTDSIAIRTAYPGLAATVSRTSSSSATGTTTTNTTTMTTDWNSDPYMRRMNPATVDYTVMVPRGARLDNIQLVNGTLQVEGLDGRLNASSVNGEVTATQVSGEVKLSTVNGRLRTSLGRAKPGTTLVLSSVNGGIILDVASGASATIRATNVRGSIANDFNFTVRRGAQEAREMDGMLGNGGASVSLSNVNGAINIRRVQ